MRNCHAVLLVLVVMLACPLWAEEPGSEKPASETSDKKDPVNPPWSFKHAVLFDIEHTEAGETKLGAQRIDYKDRGANESRIRAALVNSDADPAKIQLNVSAFTGFVKNWEGQRWDYSLDKGSFTEMRGDKTIRQVKLSGKPEDHAALKSAMNTPWAELNWKDSSSSAATLTAQAFAQPLAETASLDRQIEILLPPMPTENLAEGSTFHQDVAVPSSVPLKGVSRVTLTYKVIAIQEHRFVEIDFEGEDSEKVSSGFEWGGIAALEMTVNVKIKGKLTRDTHHQTLTAGLIEYDVDLSSKRSAFKSQVKGKSEWKRREQ